MRVLLVGGNGFIGSHIKDSLLLSGIEVSVLDCSPERYRPTIDNVKVYLGDQADPNLAQHALAGVDAVVYLASVTIPQTSAIDPVRDVVGNLVPFLGFLDLARQEKIRRFVFFSSGGTVYGPPASLPVSEVHPSQPIVSYGIVKLMMEKYLFLSDYNDGMEVVILRVGNAYGERQDPFGQFGAIATFLGCFARGQPITIWGNGEISRDYVYVKDITAACLAALTVKAARGIYNIGTARGYSLNNLIEIIAEVSHKPVPTIQWKEPRTYDIRRIVLDNTLARKKLGWEPVTSLVDGIGLTWEWVSSLSSSKRNG